MKLDGTLIDSRQLTKRGTTAFPEYTHLDLDGTGVLHAAWTSLNPPLRGYWGIHHAQSADGGTTWTTFTGTPLPLPIIADESGASDRITLDDEFKPSTWLSSMRIKDGKAHFLYRADMTPARQHHVRIDIATGQREVDHQDVSLQGETLALSGLDGLFATDARKPAARSTASRATSAAFAWRVSSAATTAPPGTTTRWAKSFARATVPGSINPTPPAAAAASPPMVTSLAHSPNWCAAAKCGSSRSRRSSVPCVSPTSTRLVLI